MLSIEFGEEENCKCCEHRDRSALRIETPFMIHDLLAERLRLMQTAHGYAAIVMSGEVMQGYGTAIGTRPG